MSTSYHSRGDVHVVGDLLGVGEEVDLRVEVDLLVGPRVAPVPRHQVQPHQAEDPEEVLHREPHDEHGRVLRVLGNWSSLMKFAHGSSYRHRVARFHFLIM